MTYEAHITVLPPEEPNTLDKMFEYMPYKEFVRRTEELGWKASKFDHDAADGMTGKWFATARAATREAILNEARGMLHGMQCAGLTVLRWKIEETIADSAAGHSVDDVLAPPHPLTRLVEDVRLFHLTFEHPAPTSPTMQDSALTGRRIGWIGDELEELEEAETIHEQADAYLDIIYFACGGLVELGLRDAAGTAWAHVQDANMAKVWPDGTVKRDKAGKVLKPEGWTAPDEAIRAAIDKEMPK